LMLYVIDEKFYTRHSEIKDSLHGLSR
jgi:hypothetical protein